MSDTVVNQHLQRANACAEQGDIASAAFAYQQALALAPGCEPAWRGLADLYRAIDRLDKSVECLQQACELRPDWANLSALGECFNQLSHWMDATKVYQFALSQAPESAKRQYAYALQLINTAEAATATPMLDKLKDADHSRLSAYAWMARIRLTPAPQLPDLTDALKQHYAAARNDDPEAKMVLAYALGLAFDGLNQQRQAADHFQVANALQHNSCSFSTAQMGPLFAALKAQYPDLSALSSADSQQAVVPVFILGMPRTGSTLLEQMLIQHPAIQSVGEVNYLGNSVVRMLEHGTSAPFPACASRASKAQLNQAATRYLQCLDQHQFSARYIINKLPANFQNIGLIMQLFPNARIIDIRRNAKEMALSIYKHHFASSEPYFCDLAELHLYYRHYQDLMAHWQGLFPAAITGVQYESLIAAPEQELRRLAAFLGCGFDPACLTPHKTRGYVATLSATQVKQPVYSRARQRAPAYAPYLPQLALFAD